ncbi:MAG TPA: glycosyltransferase family 10 [Luteolibacter sp.]|nr:glycosyltransferase family 10 [Luteolibacter sp.]
MTSPIRVKFLSRVRLPDLNVGPDFLRRFRGRVPEMGRCRFIFDNDCRDYDWLVVYDDLPRDHTQEPLACPRGNTLLITGEPSSITHFGRSFLKQFGHVLTSQEPWALEHPGVIRQQAGLYWYYGGSDERGTLDSLLATPPMAKTKLISSVCSMKAMRHTLHSLRLSFTQRLMRDLPELEVFGYGMGKLDNKADALDPYRYHLAIENHSCPHHWTEKIADAFLGYTLPFYFGCTNLDEYFPADSYVWIDIRNYDEALKRIREVIAADDYEARLPAIIEARRRVLEDYATFPQLARLIGERATAAAAPSQDTVVYSRRLSRKRNPLDWPAEIFVKIRQKLGLRG